MSRKSKTTDDGFSLPSRIESKPIDAGGGTASGDNKPEGGNQNFELKTEPIISGPSIIDPAAAPDPGNSGEPRRRGRPPGSTSKAKVSPDLSKLEGILKGGSLLIGRLLDDEDEWKLDEEEAKYLSETYLKLVSLYTVRMDPKKLAWSEAGIATAVVLGPRVVRSMKRRPAAPVRPIQVMRERPTESPAPATNAAPKDEGLKLTPLSVWPQNGGSDGGPV